MPMRIQLLLKLVGDDFQTRESMLPVRPVEIVRIMGPKETIPKNEVTITDGMRLLALEESHQPALPELKLKVLHELVRGPSENVRNAATHLVRVYRSQWVNGTYLWISERDMFGSSWILLTLKV